MLKNKRLSHLHKAPKKVWRNKQSLIIVIVNGKKVGTATLVKLIKTNDLKENVGVVNQ